jgi:glycosyltransferase involved in cell wall biosynthesis
LFCSYAFHPSIGGIETVALLLAEQFVARGLEIQVVTNIPAGAGGEGKYAYPVHRRPSRGELLRLVRWSDLVFHCNISLNYVWPLLLAPRPLVIASHTPIDATIEKSGLKRWLKFVVLRRASAISVSKYLASTIPAPSRVIYNPLRAGTFFRDPSVVRDKQLLFVGRLTAAKGVDVLLRALGDTEGEGHEPGAYRGGQRAG